VADDALGRHGVEVPAGVLLVTIVALEGVVAVEAGVVDLAVGGPAPGGGVPLNAPARGRLPCGRQALRACSPQLTRTW